MLARGGEAKFLQPLMNYACLMLSEVQNNSSIDEIGEVLLKDIEVAGY